MYSYQHRYHAGNWVDIHKHLVLLSLLHTLQQKDLPYCVLDAFAGEGIYDLNNKESQKNKEYLYGFSKLQNILDPPHIVQEFIKITNKYKNFIYPGSPAIIYSTLRDKDRAIFIENHPQAYLELKKNFNNIPQIHVHKRNAMEAINALIPFKEKRGLIFIDPSYEVKTEYQLISSIIQKAYNKFPLSIYMIWYPLLKENRHINLIRELKNCFDNNIWQHEYIHSKNNTIGVYGSGIIIINPPWKFNIIIQNNLKNIWLFN